MDPITIGIGLAAYFLTPGNESKRRSKRPASSRFSPDVIHAPPPTIDLKANVHDDRQLLEPPQEENEMLNTLARANPAARAAELVRSDRAARNPADPRIVCIASNKGGSGKTTIAQCLAVEALRQGMPSAIVDTDPQRSAFKWGEHRTALDIAAPAVVIQGAHRSLKDATKELIERGAQFIIIDTPPHSLPTINSTLEAASGVVMVTRPNPMDLDALETTWGIVSRMKLPCSTILTQTPPGDRARALKLAQGRLDELGIDHCPTPISYTLGFPYAQAEALTVQEREPTSKARAEVAEVWSWCKRQGVF